MKGPNNASSDVQAFVGSGMAENRMTLPGIERSLKIPCSCVVV